VILRYFGLSFAAWVGSIPLSAYYFHLFSPVSTLANVFAVPIGTFGLMANLGALFCGTWLPWVTVLLNNTAWGAMKLMTWVSVEATHFPGAYFYVPAPTAVSVLLYYAIIVAAFSGWFKTARRRLSGVSALSVIGIVYLCRWEMSRSETDITVLPLDGGHAIYVDADGRANDWLINTGNHDAALLTTREYLRAQGVNRIPHLILAGASARNCGGAEMLSTNWPVDELETASGKFHSMEYRVTLDALDKAVRRHNSWSAGTNAGCWRVIYPGDTTGFARAEDRPLVLMGHFSGTRILLLSDLSRASQSDLLSYTNDLHADIVIAGLPDEGEPLCNALIAAIQPKAIIIADSDFPADRRAPDALKERLAATGITVIYTREAGAVKIVTGNGNWRMVKARP
jgi:competence protein ComEC